MKNQIEFLLNFTSSKGIIVDEIIEDIGSGLNYNRRKWNKLIEECMENKVDSGLMSIFWTQKVKLFYAALLANNSH